MPTPPRPGWIAALLNSVWFPEGAPVAAPDRRAAGQLGPSSMSVLCLSGRRQAAAVRLHRRQAGSPVYRPVFAGDRRIAVGLGLPAAFQPAIAIEPMTSQRRGWNSALAPRAAKTRKVVIGVGCNG